MTLKYTHKIIAVILCLISMALTANFVTSFSTDSSRYSLVLLVIIGIALDLSKYIFWYSAPRLLSSYAALSIIIVIFSLAASLAFFLNSNTLMIEKNRKLSHKYIAYESELKAIDDQIKSTKELMDKRLSSKFHDQWEEGKNEKEILMKLYKAQTDLLNKEQDIGLNDALENTATSALFIAISEPLNISSNTVKIIFYSILALLIELSALALVSLSKTQKSDIGNKDKQSEFVKSDFADNTQQQADITSDSNEAALPCSLENDEIDISTFGLNSDDMVMVEDVLCGKMEPIFNKLKNQDYPISHQRIRYILSLLKQHGLLIEGGKRNTLILNNKVSVNRTSDFRLQ